MAVVAVGPNLQLPWSSSQDDDRRFWRVLGILCVPLLILSIAVPYIDVPEPKREELEQLPPQLARVVLEKKELPKPPPPPPPEEKKPEEKKPEEKKPEPKPEEKKPEPKPLEPKKADPEPVKLQKAIEQAKQSGVMAQLDTLADMRDALAIDDVKKPVANKAGAAATASETVDRSLIGKAATKTSGGVNTAALSRDTGGVALSGRETTVVSSKLEEVSAAAADNRQQQTREKAYRGDQAIRQKMEEAKGRIFGIYNRALRENPTLQGKVVFKLVIEPNGSVSNAQIVSSELNDPDLERKLLAAVRGINFGGSDVLQTTLNYSFDFLPY